MGQEAPFDAVLLSQARLGVVSVLVARPSVTFSDLKALLGLTQGNLGLHLRQLEEAGYVLVKKEFVARKPRTTYRLSARGRRAFLDHVTRLQSIAADAHKPSTAEGGT
ncbi:MAG TPA: transcriptional regulator [Planctomycetota bacterium]|nr:transcriptional regulator [Planctomycetota bacterium]